MNRFARVLLILTVIGCCVGIDQVVKGIARHKLAGAAPIPVLGGLVILEYAENPGAFMSLGARWSLEARALTWVGLVGLMMVIGLVYLVRSEELALPQTVAVACVIGGGIGNLLDRLFNNGLVIDYMSLGIGRLRTGILNLADLFVTLGVVALIWSVTRSRSGRPAIETESS